MNKISNKLYNIMLIYIIRKHEFVYDKNKTG